MFFTSVFGFFASIALGAPLWAWVVGFLCVIPAGILTPFFGFFLCIALGAPAWAYLVGFMCVVFDLIMIENSN